MELAPPRTDPGGVLLAAARAGDASAFWQLTEGQRPYLHEVVARLLGSRLAGKVDPADVLQQGLLRAFHAVARFRGQGLDQWHRWLRVLVRNQTRKVVRYWHQAARDVRRERPLAQGSGSQLDVAADQATPSQRAVRHESDDRLKAALRRLPPDHQQVIQLRIFDNLSFAAVAGRMNRSEEAVRKLWERAIKKMRAEWRDAA